MLLHVELLSYAHGQPYWSRLHNSPWPSFSVSPLHDALKMNCSQASQAHTLSKKNTVLLHMQIDAWHLNGKWHIFML